MGRSRLGFSGFLIIDDFARFMIALVHVVRIAVIRRHNQNAVGFFYRLDKSTDTQIDSLNGNLNCLGDAGMPDHVTVGIIEPDKIVSAAQNGIDDLVGNLGRFHPGALLKGDVVRGHLDVIL